MKFFELLLRRRRILAGAAVALTLLAGSVAPMFLAPASASAATPAKSGVVVLSSSGSVTASLTSLGVTPAAGSGAQICDPDADSYTFLYLARPGTENAPVTGDLPSSFINTVPANGTLPQLFAAGDQTAAFPTPVTGELSGVYNLGIRCEKTDGSAILQNYWTTITVTDGTWTVGGDGTPPTTDPTAPTSPTSPTSPTETTTAPPVDTLAGALTIAPASGTILDGGYTVGVQPSGTGEQSCGPTASVAFFYFAPAGSEFEQVSGMKWQALGQVPAGGTIAEFLRDKPTVSFTENQNARQSWSNPLDAGAYSLGLRCQTGPVGSAVIRQNYVVAVDVADDGSWHVKGSNPSTSPTTTPTPTDSPTTTPTDSPTPIKISATTPTGTATGTPTRTPTRTPTGTTPTISSSTSGKPAGNITVSLTDINGNPMAEPVSVIPGQQLVFAADGLDGAEQATVVMRSTPVTLATVAAVGGVITTPITIPAAAIAGTHTLTVTGATSGRTVTLPITVRAASSTTTNSVTTPAGSTDPDQSVQNTLTTSPDGAPAANNGGYGNGGGGSVSNGPVATAGSSLAYTGVAVMSQLTVALLALGLGAAVLALSTGGRPARYVRRH